MINVDNKVVVRFRDGRIVKGVTRDFNPTRSNFHVIVENSGNRMEEILNSDLKAVFFVKSLEGNPNAPRHRVLTKGDLAAATGIKLKVTFSDGEVLYGSTAGYSPDRQGFFLQPLDTDNNNRVFVIKDATTAVERVK